MSAHEKKRYYLEALEQYVIYLHDQLRLVHTEPLPLQRVATYPGMSSRSIRVYLFFSYLDPELTFTQTLLVHMEDSARNLNLQVVTEEHMVRLDILSCCHVCNLSQFLDLRAQVLESQPSVSF